MQTKLMSLAATMMLAADAGDGAMVDAAAAAAEEANNDNAADQPVIANGKKNKFFFKKEKIKDATGKVIGEGRKHPDVEAMLPMPTEVEVIEYLSHAGEKTEDGKAPTAEAKVAALIMEGLQDLVIQAARNQINDWLEKEENKGGIFVPNLFDLSKLSLAYISTLEKGSRGGWAPSEEELKAFGEEYSNVFLHVLDYDAKKVPLHVDHYQKGLTKLRNDKRALEKMVDFLALWAANAKPEAVEEHQETYDWLVARCHKWLKVEEKNYAEAL